MTVKVNGGTIVLEGNCTVEEAEALLAGLLEHPGATVSLQATHIHTALWQVLLALRPKVQGPAPNRFSELYVLRLLDATEETAHIRGK